MLREVSDKGGFIFLAGLILGAIFAIAGLPGLIGIVLGSLIVFVFTHKKHS